MVDHELLQAISQMMDEKLKKELEPLKEEVRRIAITQENVVMPQLQLVYENQVDIIEEHKAMNRLERKVEVLQDEVFAIKEVIKELKRA